MESEKIRSYIMGLIYRHNRQSVQVPSSTELAAEFRVARRTARIALEGLVKEGWLIGKRGLGTYTNPARRFTVQDEPVPLVGVIYGRGDNFFYDTPACLTITSLARAVAERGFNTRLFAQLEHDADEVLAELMNSRLDGLLWASDSFPPEEMLQKLKDSGVKIVTVDRRVPGIGSICFDKAAAWRQVAERLIAEGRRRITMPVVESRYSDPVIDQLQAGFRAHGVTPELNLLRGEIMELPKMLREVLTATELPEVLCVGPGGAVVVRQLGVDFIDGCRLVVNESCAGSPDLPALVVERPFPEAARAAVAELARQFADPSSEEQHLVIDEELKTQNLEQFNERS